MNQKVKMWKNISLPLLQRIEKAGSRGNIKGIAGQALDTEIMDEILGSNQPFQPRPGQGLNEGTLLNFWDSSERTTIPCEPYLSRKGKNDPEGNSER